MLKNKTKNNQLAHTGSSNMKTCNSERPAHIICTTMSFNLIHHKNKKKDFLLCQNISYFPYAFCFSSVPVSLQVKNS